MSRQITTESNVELKVKILDRKLSLSKSFIISYHPNFYVSPKIRKEKPKFHVCSVVMEIPAF